VADTEKKCRTAFVRSEIQIYDIHRFAVGTGRLLAGATGVTAGSNDVPARRMSTVPVRGRISLQTMKNGGGGADAALLTPSLLPDCSVYKTNLTVLPISLKCALARAQPTLPILSDIAAHMADA
jgi:hypothetical protein